MMLLKIGALAIPTISALDLEQSYSAIGGESLFRTVDGTALKQETWKKLRVVTSGSGWLPDGLDTLDTTALTTVSCIKPRAVPANFATRQATLPGKRRSDSGHVPWGVALMADGSPVYTAASMAGNVATLAAVSGAVAYLAMYLPEITAWIMRPTDSCTRSDASYRWELVAEEV